ncbi:MAG TPA: response regulator [Candidatus Saccharimonadales bacterium]|nr:response regulator [Candidatus Saccharimonadales bacterium]
MKTILIVEDNKQYRELLHDALKKEGYAVLTAENGNVALDVVREKSLDLILLDLLMPELDGVSFYVKLQNVLKKHIPIIVLTNLTDTTAYGVDIKDVIIKANTSLQDVVKKIKESL